MTEGLNGIITQLERQRTAIDKALSALRDVEGTETPAPISTLSSPAKRKGGMTPAGKKRLIAALKKRWAAKKATGPRSLSVTVVMAACQKLTS